MLRLVSAGGAISQFGVERIASRIPIWTSPYSAFRNDHGHDDEDLVITEACGFIDPKLAFVWFGGVVDDFPPPLIRWKLYQMKPERFVLDRDASAGDVTMVDVGYTELGFQEMTKAYPQIITIAPNYIRPNPSRNFEREYVQWMSRNPYFRARAKKPVDVHGGIRLITVYERN